MVCIPMGTSCVPLLPDLFLCSYENEFLDILVKEGTGTNLALTGFQL